jgi:hypothetical protein
MRAAFYQTAISRNLKKFSRRTIAVTCLGIIVILVIFLPTLGITTQSQERIIEKRSTSATPDEPVKITIVKTKKGVVGLGEKFQDDDEWFKGLIIKVENSSGKNITYINIEISFERPQDNDTIHEPPLVHSLTYGSRISLTGNPAQFEVNRLVPGETVDLVLSDIKYDRLKTILNKLKYPPSIKHLQMYIGEVIFDDNTSWSAGHMFRRDPNDPEKWIPLEQPQGSARNRTAKFLAYLSLTAFNNQNR